MPFPLAAAAPILAAGVSAVSNIFTNWRNQKLANEQNQFNLNMWKAQNQYNTPAEQLARLKQAGINPNFMGSSIASGNVAASASPSADLANQVSPFTPEVGAQVASAIIEGKNAETNAKNAETEAKNADTNAKNAETNRLRQEVDAELAGIEGEVKKEQKLFIIQQRLNAQQELDNIIAQGEQIREQTKGQQQQNRQFKVAADLAEKYGEQQIVSQLNEAASRIKLNVSQAELAKINAKLAPVLAECSKKQAQAALTSAEAARTTANSNKEKIAFEVGKAFENTKEVSAAQIKMYEAIAYAQYAGILGDVFGKFEFRRRQMADRLRGPVNGNLRWDEGTTSNPYIYNPNQIGNPSSPTGYLPWLR